LNRICAACDSTTTYVYHNGNEQWHTHDGYWLCHKCFEKYVHSPVYGPVRNEKWNPINGPRRQMYKYRQVVHKQIPRKGICERCGVTNKRTNLHHEEYDDNNPLAHTVELCASCHMKTSWELGQLT
jgi:hypothetical protein